MTNNFQKRLFEMELTPPHRVWEKLSECLYEINSDNLTATKIQEAELIPPPGVWEKITESLFEKDKPEFKKKRIVVSLKRVAAAAVFTGLIISAWYLFFNTGQKNTNLVITETLPVNEKTILPGNSVSIPPLSEAETNQIKNSKPLSAENNKLKANITRSAIVQMSLMNRPAIVTPKKLLVFQDEKPGNKIFDKPIDDLSLVTTDNHYMTMVNANGRILKIPAHLAHLAPHLQNKPISEDYYEILFGEGAFWKNKLNDWRQLLATAPVSSGDIFSNFLELLKSVQAQKDETVEQGK